MTTKAKGITLPFSLPLISIKSSPYNAVGDDVTNDTAAFNLADSIGATIPVGTYATNAVQLRYGNFIGVGYQSILKAISAGTILNLGQMSLPSQWERRYIKDIALDGNSFVSHGITFSDTANTEVSGRWNLDSIFFQNCDKAIYKPSGNIGNIIYNCTFSVNNYGYYAVGQVSPTMHPGADIISICHFDSHVLAAIYIDGANSGTGGTAIRDTIIENNPGFGIFVNNYVTSYTPLVLDHLWFEANATSVSVTINAVAYTPKDIYLRNSAQVVLSNSIVPKIQLVNSKLSVKDCFLTYDLTNWTIDSTSTVLVESARLAGGLHPVVVKSILSCTRPLSNFAAAFYSEPLDNLSYDTVNLLDSESYAKGATYQLTGTTTVTGTSVNDGKIFNRCAEFAVAASTTESTPSFSVTNDKWYVLTIDIKSISGTLSDLLLTISGTSAFGPNIASLLVQGEWRTLVVIGLAQSSFSAKINFINGSIGTQTFRLSARQVGQFDTEQQAINFYNSNTYLLGTAYPKTIYSPTMPTAETWTIGDRAINSNPTVGQPKAWSRITTGAGNVLNTDWISEGNL